MKQSVLLFIIFLLSTMFLSAQEWEIFSSAPGSGSHHSYGFALNGKGYLVTGSTIQGPSDLFYEYDPIQNQWSTKQPFPGGARSFAIGDVWDNKSYMGFGVDAFNNYLNDLWVWDPDTDSWTELASCPCSGRAHPAFIAHNDHIFVGMGSNTRNNRDWWVYDINNNTWTRAADFPSVERHHPFQFGVGDYVYAGFGHGPSIYDEWYRYDLETDSWAQMANIPDEGRVAGTQFSSMGKGYVLSGDGDDHGRMQTGEFWEYTPETDSWNELPPHPGFSRWAPSSFVLNHTVYFMNGIVRNPFIYATGNFKYPLLEAEIVLTDSLGCAEGDLASVEVLINGDPVPDFEYSWNTGDDTRTLDGLSEGSYLVTVTTPEGVLRAELDIAPQGIPSSSLDALVNPDCFGDANGSITLANDPDLSFEWSNGQQGPVADNLAEGNYEVTVTNQEGCSGVDTFTIIQPPVLDLLALLIINSTGVDGSIEFIVSGGTGLITAYLLDESATDTLASSNAGNVRYDDLAPGNYRVLLVDDNGCELLSDVIVVEQISSVDDLGENDQWKAYPNPAVSYIQLEGTLLEQGNASLRLVNSTGQTVWTRDLQQGTASMKLDVTGFAEGMYFLEWNREDQRMFHKLYIYRD